MTLDRTLAYQNHLTKVAAKIKTRNNIIRKLANTNWGSDPNTTSLEISPKPTIGRLQPKFQVDILIEGR